MRLKRRNVAVAVAAVALFAYLMPMIPMSLGVRYGAVHASAADAGLPAQTIEEIVEAVRGHQEFARSFDEGYLDRISLNSFLFGFRSIGILSIQRCDPGTMGQCDASAVVVHAGFDCGEFCGGAEIYQATQTAGGWVVELVGWSVD